MTKTGGCGGGTIRFKEELEHGGNAGLGESAEKWLIQIILVSFYIIEFYF